MIPLVKVNLPNRDVLMPKLENILYSGMIAEGDCVYEFEEKFACKFGLENVIAMSSGTAALHASLVLAGVKAGDEVITTSMTAEPTNVVILQIGAIPVFADVHVASGNVDPEDIERKITKKTKAIIIVHYAGIPCKIDDITKVSSKYRIPLIEDCAHALGAKYGDKAIGSWGDFAIFSLQAIKHMTTVDGGLLVLKDKSLVRAAKKFRWFGLEKGIPRTEVDITSVGYKYNMHNIAATIGLAQLDVIDIVIDRHIDNGKYFDNLIPNIPGLAVPVFDEIAKPSYWLYTVFSDDSQDVEKRLGEIGVLANKLHRPNHLHSIFRGYAGKLPNLETYYRKMVHIPCGWWVTDENREHIVNALQKG